MILVWMIASVFVALLFAAGAAILTRVGMLYRGVPLRFLWAGGIVASVAVAGWMAIPRATRSAAMERSLDAATMPPASPHEATRRLPEKVAQFPRPENIEVPELPANIELSLLAVWAASSVGFIVLLTRSLRRLRRDARLWRGAQVAATDVLVSEDFGPAVVGIYRPVIVVPEWVLASNEVVQRAIVVHETEHRLSGDHVLLLTGIAGVVLMPWNIGLWLSWRGLRHATELDCDARVVARGTDAGTYAGILLHALENSRGGMRLSVAFARRASGLGARVEHLLRREPRRKAMKTMIGIALAVVLSVAATAAPAIQERTHMRPAAHHPLVIIDGVKHAELEGLGSPGAPSRDQILEMQMLEPPVAEARFGAAAKYGVAIFYTKKYVAEGGQKAVIPGANHAAFKDEHVGERNSAIMNDLFKGIVLSQEAMSKARTLIGRERNASGSYWGPLPVAKRKSLIRHRDEQLRALLRSDDDRQRFDDQAAAWSTKELAR
ncbi:MAG: M56 family metallopeptidase [Gemmatimonadota bacterium]